MSILIEGSADASIKDENTADMKKRKRVMKSSENEQLSELGIIMNLDITMDVNDIYNQLIASRDVKEKVKHMVTEIGRKEWGMQSAHQPSSSTRKDNAVPLED